MTALRIYPIRSPGRESDFENVITARNYIAHSNGMSIPEETRQKWYDSCDRILRIRSSLDE